MTTPPLFPTLRGVTFSITKTPTWSSRIASHVSGRDIRQALWANPLYEFELKVSGLDSGAVDRGLGIRSLQTLIGLYNSSQGQIGTFRYVDATDNAVANQPTGQGDGTTLAFPLYRTIGGSSEQVTWVESISSVSVAGSVVDPSTYSLVAPNLLTFATAPAADAEIEASFSYSFLCRFIADTQDFEQFMTDLWSVGSLKFRSVKDYL